MIESDDDASWHTNRAVSLSKTQLVTAILITLLIVAAIVSVVHDSKNDRLQMPTSTSSSF